MLNQKKKLLWGLRILLLKTLMTRVIVLLGDLYYKTITDKHILLL